MVNLGLGNGRGFAVNTNETGNTRSGADSDPGVVVKNHLDKNIAGEGFFLGFDFLAAADGHFGLDGNNGLKDFVGEVHGFDPGLEGVDDFVFVAGVGVDDVPGGVNGRFLIGKLELKFFFTGKGRSFGHDYFLMVGVGEGAEEGRMSIF